MLAIRVSKIVLVFSIALMAGLPGVNNLIDYNVNLAHIQHVVMMDTHIIDHNYGWRAITAPWMHHLLYIMIIITELAIGVLGVWASIDLWKVRHDTHAFNKNKTKAIWVLTLGVLVWLSGFLAIGGEWFLMWLSTDWNSQQPAFRLAVIMILGLIFISMKDEDY